MTRPAPIIAAVLLLLPVLYVGSYLAMVTPRGTWIVTNSLGPGSGYWQEYRAAVPICRVVFRPLEQIDRKLRKWKIADSRT